MRKAVLALAVIAALAGAAVVAAYVYAASRDDVVPAGATAGGVEIGGLSESAARARISETLRPRFSRPIVVEYRARSFRVSPSALELRLDAEGMVERALRARGNFLVRTARDIGGVSVDEDVPVEVAYSRAALTATASRIASAIERRPRNARVSFVGRRLRTVPERDGVVVPVPKLERALARALRDPDPGGTVKVAGERRRPKVTTAKLAARYPRLIVVSRPEKKLRFYKRLKLAKTYSIAIGQAGVETPAGFYRIETKAINPAWHVPERPWAGELAGQIVPPGSPQNPIKARWMEFHAGAGIHGTDDIASLGDAASHGCIRMSIPDVIELYRQVPVKTPIYIA
jgi:lipoprotein-anchoring transpeptidase ErfK/SrfK